jgi:hypothetical protein
MGRRTSESQSDAQGRVETGMIGENKAASEVSNSQFYMQAYQAMLARELLINDLHEQDSKHF